MCQGSLKGVPGKVSRVLQECFKNTTKKVKGCSKCFNDGFKLCQGNFKVASRVVKSRKHGKRAYDPEYTNQETIKEGIHVLNVAKIALINEVASKE